MKKQMRWLLYAMNFLAFFAISMFKNPRYNSTEDFSISTKTVTIRRRCGCDEQRTDKWFKT